MQERREPFGVFLIESAWILPSIAIPVTLFVVILLTTFVVHVRLPGRSDTISPQQIDQTAPFNHPGLQQTAPGAYTLAIIAQTWQWTPNTIRIPLGATVQFDVTSRDVTHGLLVDGTDVNLTVIPGRISQTTYRFLRPGVYRFLCQEYCGLGHQTMGGQITVGAQ